MAAFPAFAGCRDGRHGSLVSGQARHCQYGGSVSRRRSNVMPLVPDHAPFLNARARQVPQFVAAEDYGKSADLYAGVRISEGKRSFRLEGTRLAPPKPPEGPIIRLAMPPAQSRQTGRCRTRRHRRPLPPAGFSSHILSQGIAAQQRQARQQPQAPEPRGWVGCHR